MDKQTAIDLLDNLLGMVEDNHDSDYDTAIKMGIDALKSNAPNALSALDCVERQAAVDAIRAKDDYSNVAVALGLGKAMTAVCELPSVQPDIIQCKDCVNWQTEWEPQGEPGIHFCAVVDGFHDGDWYCADAKRRTNE